MKFFRSLTLETGCGMIGEIFQEAIELAVDKDVVVKLTFNGVMVWLNKNTKLHHVNRVLKYVQEGETFCDIRG